MVGNKEINPSEEEEKKLEDILASIRGIIDNNNPDEIQYDIDDKEFENYDDHILELTSIVDHDSIQPEKRADSSLISEVARTKSVAAIKDFTKKVEGNSYFYEEKPVDNIINDLMKPLLKEWLDNNLPRLVEKVVTEEMRRLVPKK